MIGFVHIPKTAGTTIKFIMRNSTFLRHCDIKARNNHTMVDEDLKFAQKLFFFGLKSIGGHHLYYPTYHLTASIHYFTFVRDPLNRCLSHYQHVKRSRLRAGKDIDFAQFISDECMRNVQVRWIAGGEDVEKAKQELQKYMLVGLTERFAESVAMFKALSPYKINLRYERRHVTRDNSAKQKVLDDPALFKLLQESNTLDRELYRFVENTIFPAQLKKTGLEHSTIDEKNHAPDPIHIRYRITRGYNHSLYRSLMKMRHRRYKKKRLRRVSTSF